MSYMLYISLCQVLYMHECMHVLTTHSLPNDYSLQREPYYVRILQYVVILHVHIVIHNYVITYTCS